MFSSNTTQVSDGGYQISRSLRFNSADSAYVTRTPSVASNRRTWTWSGWVKRSSISVRQIGWGASTSDFNTDTHWEFNSSDQIRFSTYVGAIYFELITTAVYRDPSAWYHIVATMDTTQATASDRAKLYVNGVQVTAFSTATYPSQNYETQINTTLAHSLGRDGAYDGFYFSGYQTEVNFIDGQALTPSSFGETNAQTGVWQPKAYSGSYGTNGFYLNFSDNSNTTAATLGKDYSGNGNNWTPNNFSVTAGGGNDSLVDSPTSYGTTDTGVGGEIRGNYSTLNPLFNATTLTNGNLDASLNAISTTGTFGSNSGKWYFECTFTSLTGTSYLGIADQTLVKSDSSFSYSQVYVYLSNSQKGGNGGSATYGSSYTTGDVIGIAYDLDSGSITFYKNGTSQGVAYSTGFTSGYFWRPFLYCSATTTATFNFGQRPFAYTAPSGYKALCTQNLSTPTIGATTATQAGKYFNPVLYTGNGSTQSITGVGFQPDMTWIKVRSTTYDHQLVDAVRGSGKVIHSNLTNAEATLNTVTSFNSDGFTVNGTTYAGTNGNGSTFVAWNWKANGTGSTNTAGSITSTVSANTTSGFSVVTYTGNSTVIAGNGTVGHGLGVVPSMVIIKRRDNTGFWYVATKDGGTPTSPTYSVFTRGSSGLNQTGAAFATGQTYASSGYITSSTLNLYWLNAAVTAGDSYDINFLTATYVAYCFAEISGYSKFGSYTGNGSSDGPFIYTGFRPAYVMVKPSSAAGAWWINDNKRDPYNVNDHRLNANTSDAEATSGFTQQDFLSNGFKWRNSDSAWNGSGVTYIYMAFAENPFKYSLAR